MRKVDFVVKNLFNVCRKVKILREIIVVRTKKDNKK